MVSVNAQATIRQPQRAVRQREEAAEPISWRALLGQVGGRGRHNGADQRAGQVSRGSCVLSRDRDRLIVRVAAGTSADSASQKATIHPPRPTTSPTSQPVSGSKVIMRKRPRSAARSISSRLATPSSPSRSEARPRRTRTSSPFRRCTSRVSSSVRPSSSSMAPRTSPRRRATRPRSTTAARAGSAARRTASRLSCIPRTTRRKSSST